MKQTILILLSTVFCISSAFGGQACKTLGFTIRDGMAFPVVECSGMPDVAFVNSFGGSLSYWGMMAQQSGRANHSYSIDTSINPPQINQTTSPFKFKVPDSQPYTAPIDSATAAIQANKEFVRSMRTQIDSLNQYNNFLNAQRGALNSTSDPLAGFMAGMAVVIKITNEQIYAPIASQIAFEKSLNQNLKNSNESVQRKILDSTKKDLSEINNNAQGSLATFNANQFLETNVAKAIDTVRLASKNSPSYSTILPQIATAAGGVIAAGDESRKPHAVSALALTLASANALSDGMENFARTYAKAAATTLDIALGFIPATSSINDLTQIAFGLATGKNYVGDPMDGSEYALRAFGVVLGVLPVAYLGKIAITKAYVHGADFLRKHDYSYSLIRQIGNFDSKVARVIEVAGALSPKNFSDLENIKSVKILLPKLFSHSLDILQRLPDEKVGIIFKTLVNESYSLRDRWQILTSFEVGTLDVVSLKKGTKLYRWSNTDNVGRYYTVDSIPDVNVARRTLALPPENKLETLREYVILNDTIALGGKIAAAFGHPGGAQQIFLNSKNLNSIGVIK